MVNVDQNVVKVDQNMVNNTIQYNNLYLNMCKRCRLWGRVFNYLNCSNLVKYIQFNVTTYCAVKNI